MATREARLEDAIRRFAPHPVVERFREYVLTADDEELFHIDPNHLSGTWNVSRRTVIELFLRGVRYGILSLEWAFHCPTCGGVAKESLRLSESHEHEYCPVCRVDFRNTLDDNVEVFFSVSPEIRPLPPHFRAAYESRIVDDIQRSGHHAWRTEATISGVEVLTNPVFRDIFGDETLPLDQSLEIRAATILFSDVTGSTAMYERLGDARAFRLIRDHFNVVFQAIATHGGSAIKTIGDEVMGVFVDEVSAVRAAFDMQDALDESNRVRGDGEDLQLKIGVNRGPVIAVTLNGRIDYFGRTVNVAARIQAVAASGELAMGEAFIRAPGVAAALRARVNHARRGVVSMKGIDGRMPVYRVRLT